MGKDRGGRELGQGISQREDGLYVARYTNKYGKRVQKILPKLQELRQWLADAQYKEEHSNIDFPDAMTVNALFNMLDYVYQNDVILKNPCNKNVGITMNLYVHVTEDEKVKEVEKIEKSLKIV